jgi:hypothetical protein
MKRVRVAGISWGTFWVLEGILHKAREDHLDQVHSDQKILKVIRQGRLVLVIGGQESQN